MTHDDLAVAESDRYPGIFIKRRPRKASPESSVTSDDSSEAPPPLLGPELTSTTTSEDVLSSGGGVPGPPEEDPQTEHQQQEKQRRRRKKTKSGSEENPALDPQRYKTTVCKNWEKNGKCPYGPRCLFAHGRKQLRSSAANNVAIEIAVASTSPDRTFREAGRFPDFMPIPPKELLGEGGSTTPPEEQDAPSCEVSSSRMKVSEISTQTPAEDTDPQVSTVADPQSEQCESQYSQSPTSAPFYPPAPSPQYLWPQCYPQTAPYGGAWTYCQYMDSAAFSDPVAAMAFQYQNQDAYMEYSPSSGASAAYSAAAAFDVNALNSSYASLGSSGEFNGDLNCSVNSQADSAAEGSFVHNPYAVPLETAQ